MGEGEPQPGRLGFSSTVQTGVQQFERRDLSHSSSHSFDRRLTSVVPGWGDWGETMIVWLFFFFFFFFKFFFFFFNFFFFFFFLIFFFFFFF